MAAGRKNFIFFLCLLDGVQFIATFRYYCLMPVQPLLAFTVTVYIDLPCCLCFPAETYILWRDDVFPQMCNMDYHNE